MCPIFPVKISEAYGKGKMLCIYAFIPLKIGNGACHL